MKAGSVAAVAVTASVTVQLNHREQIAGGIVVALHFQHPREADRNFEERPAVKRVHVGRWRLDVIVDFQGVIDVASSQ